MNDRWLKLEIGNKCGENAPNCICTGSTGNFTTSRDTDFDQVVGFVRYTHRSDEPFRLLKNIGDDEQLDVGNNQEVKGVTEVSVYYWSENERKPLLLRVVKDGVTHEPEYYYKYGGNENEAGGQQNLWRHKNHEGGISLQTRLDERNLGINNRIPLYLDEPDKPLGLGSDLAKSVTIQHVQPPPPQLVGGGYTITEYKLNGKPDTRFSRIMYDKENSGIKLPNGRITNIKLYSSLEISKVPIMLQLIPDSGDSTWFASKSTDGRSWIEVGSTDNFYKGANPTEALTNKLDGFACEHHKAVTMDLTESTSARDNQTCSGSKKKNVSVEKGTLKTGGKTMEYTKYSIMDPEHKLVDIKFYQDNDGKYRRRIRSSKFKFPMEGPVDIYTFYSGNNPALIYVHKESKNPYGWYRMQTNDGHNKRWLKIPKQLKRIKHSHIKSGNLDCRQWNDFEGVLKRGDSSLQECTQETAKQLLRSEVEGSQDIEDQDAKEEDVKASEDEQSDEEGSYTVLGAAGPKAVGAPGKPGPPGGNGLIGPNGDGGPAGGGAQASSPRGGESSWSLGWPFGSILSDIQEAVARGIGQSIVTGPAQVISAMAQLPPLLSVVSPSPEGTPQYSTDGSSNKDTSTNLDGGAGGKSSDTADGTPKTPEHQALGAEAGVPGPGPPGQGPHAEPQGGAADEETETSTTPADTGQESSGNPEAKAEQFGAGAGLATAGLGYAVISGISSGTLAGAGATFFGGWKLYSRSKGDPWVRQI